MRKAFGLRRWNRRHGTILHASNFSRRSICFPLWLCSFAWWYSPRGVISRDTSMGSTRTTAISQRTTWRNHSKSYSEPLSTWLYKIWDILIGNIKIVQNSPIQAHWYIPSTCISISPLSIFFRFLTYILRLSLRKIAFWQFDWTFNENDSGNRTRIFLRWIDFDEHVWYQQVIAFCIIPHFIRLVVFVLGAFHLLRFYKTTFAIDAPCTEKYCFRFASSEMHIFGVGSWSPLRCSFVLLEISSKLFHLKLTSICNSRMNSLGKCASISLPVRTISCQRFLKSVLFSPFRCCPFTRSKYWVSFIASLLGALICLGIGKLDGQVCDVADGLIRILKENNNNFWRLVSVHIAMEDPYADENHFNIFTLWHAMSANRHKMYPALVLAGRTISNCVFLLRKSQPLSNTRWQMIVVHEA